MKIKNVYLRLGKRNFKNLIKKLKFPLFAYIDNSGDVYRVEFSYDGTFFYIEKGGITEDLKYECWIETENRIKSKIDESFAFQLVLHAANEKNL